MVSQSRPSSSPCYRVHSAGSEGSIGTASLRLGQPGPRIPQPLFSGANTVTKTGTVRVNVAATDSGVQLTQSTFQVRPPLVGEAMPSSHPACFTQQGARPQSRAAHWPEATRPLRVPRVRLKAKSLLAPLSGRREAPRQPRGSAPQNREDGKQGSRKYELPAARENP